MNISSVLTKDYENERLCRRGENKPKQTQSPRLQSKMKPEIEVSLAPGSTPQQQPRAAYLAICLDLAETLHQRHPDQWSRALAALNNYTGLLRALFDSPAPAAAKLRTRAAAVGVKKPKKPKL